MKKTKTKTKTGGKKKTKKPDKLLLFAYILGLVLFIMLMMLLMIRFDSNSQQLKTQLWASSSTYVLDTANDNTPHICGPNESLSDCFNYISKPSGISMTGLPGSKPSLLYTTDYEGDGAYNVVAWYDDGRGYWCSMNTDSWSQAYNCASVGFTSIDNKTDIGLPSDFVPGLAYTHDYDHNDQDHTILWSKDSNEVCYWGDMNSGEKKFTCISGTSLGFPNGFVAEGARYDEADNNYLVVYGRVSGQMRYFKADIDSRGYFTNTFSEITSQVGSQQIDAMLWDAAGDYSKFDCSDTLNNCLDEFTAPKGIIPLLLPSSFKPDIMYTLDYDGDGIYNVVLWQGSKAYYCNNYDCTAVGFTEAMNSNMGLRSDFDPDLAYTHDLDAFGGNSMDTTVIWEGNEFCYWGDKQDVGHNDKFYCGYGNTVGLPTSFEPDDVTYDDDNKLLKIFDDGVCYQYDTPNTKFIPCLVEKYSISGTISGDVQENTTLTCTSGVTAYSAVSDSGGDYVIEGVPNGTVCTLVPSKSGYDFIPASALVTIDGADVSGMDFVASKTEGDCSDLGKDIADPKTEFDLSDISELEKIFLELTEGEGKDINGDGVFSYADVIALINCYNCKWNWEECGI